MGKTFAYIVLIVAALFVLEWLGVIDIPYVDLPNFNSSEQNMIHKTEEVVNQMD